MPGFAGQAPKASSERIRGELLKLGIHVSKRTIQKDLHQAGSHGPHDGQTWETFLKNHTTWACDFLQLYDIWFRPIFAFFIADVNTKRVVHIGVTRAPTEEWTAQQLREVTPFGEGPQLLIRDGDTKYGAAFDRVAQGADIEVVKIAPCAPRMNLRRNRITHPNLARHQMANDLELYGFSRITGTPMTRDDGHLLRQ